METPQSSSNSGGATVGSSAPSSSASSAPTSASLAVSPDHEVDFLKEKLEHFKLVIHKLQEELQTQKVRKEGAETVSRLLQESKQEVMALRKKVRTYEAVIRNLQSRLGNHGLPSEITLGDGEQYLPGTSKQMLDNLARENKRLRNIIRNDNGDPEELIRLQKQCQDLQEELEELRAAKNSADGLLHASDNDKDVTIARLRHDLENVRHELRTRDSLCQELAGETQSLQTQLKGVAEQCQDLARKLQEKGAGPEAKPKSQDAKQVDNKQFSEERVALERKLKEVTEMNMRWQSYNKQREQHVATLSREIAELRERAGTMPSSMAQDVQMEMNRVLDKAKEDVAKVASELKKTKRDLHSANRDRDTLKAEISRLQQRLGSAVGNDAAETIEALKAQIQICTEDFESERKDREKAQHRLAKQEAELAQLRRENDALRRAQAQPQPQQGQAGDYNDPFYHYQGVQGNYGNEGLAARGQTGASTTRRHIDKYNVIDGAQVQSDGESDVPRSRRDENDAMRERCVSSEQSSTERDANSDKNTDENFLSLRTSSLSSSGGRGISPTPPSNLQRQSATSSPVNVTSSSGERDNDGRKPGDILKCPKCDNEFTSNEHFDLLEHIEMCCE